MSTALIQEVFNKTSSSLNTITKKRKGANIFKKIMWLLTGLFFVFIILNMLSGYLYNSENAILNWFRNLYKVDTNNHYANLYPFAILFALLYPSIYLFSYFFRKFKEEESTTIKSMVKNLFPEVFFAQNINAPISEIEKSKLFAWVKKDTPIYNYGKINTSLRENDTVINDIGIIEDNVANKTLKGLMQIPFLNLFVLIYQYVIKNLSSKAADTIYYTFRGMFCWFEYPKKLNGHTVVLTNNIQTKVDRFASFNFKKEEKILLEDPRFNNHFVVYSTDQIEARYVLSTNLMEHITALKEKFDQPIMLSFINNRMYLAVENEEGLFSFPTGKLDKKTIEKLYTDIKTALNINNELKLKPNLN